MILMIFLTLSNNWNIIDFTKFFNVFSKYVNDFLFYEVRYQTAVTSTGRFYT